MLPQKLAAGTLPDTGGADTVPAAPPLFAVRMGGAARLDCWAGWCDAGRGMPTEGKASDAAGSAGAGAGGMLGTEAYAANMGATTVTGRGAGAMDSAASCAEGTPRPPAALAAAAAGLGRTTPSSLKPSE